MRQRILAATTDDSCESSAQTRRSHFSSALRRLFVLAAGLGLLLATPPIHSGSHIAGANTQTLECNGLFYVGNRTTGDYFVQTLDVGVKPAKLTAIGPATPELGPVGFNPVDGFIYGLRRSDNRLLRIGPNATVTNLGSIANLPAAIFNSGDISANGVFKMMQAGSVNRMYEIDLNASPYSARQRAINPPLPSQWADFSINPNDGAAYGALSAANGVYRISPDGVSSRLTASSPWNTGAAGAQFFDTLGNLYIYNNEGSLWRYNVNTPGVNPVFVSQVPPTLGNDGAACPTEIVAELGVAKAMTVTGNGPWTVTIDYTMANTGTDAAKDLSMTDDLEVAFGTPGVDWDLVGLSMRSGPSELIPNPAFDGRTNGDTELLAPESVLGRDTTAVLRATLTSNTPGTRSNQVELTGSSTLTDVAVVDLSVEGTDPDPDGDGDPTNDSVTSTYDLDAPTYDLEITKTSPTTWVTPGGSITYTITATNNGPDDIDTAIITDPFPPDLTCATTAVASQGNPASFSPGPVPGNINDSVGLPAGSSIDYTANCSVAATATGSLTNTATIDTPVTSDETNSTNNTASASHVIVADGTDTDGDGIPDDIDPDDDNDGNPDITDPNQKVATAVDDTGRTTPNTPVTIDVLGNDDFLPGTGTSITRTGGSALGTTVFDPVAGTLVYTPTPTETTGSVTVGYEACGTVSTPNGCDTATVTITINTDTDGDGIPDDIDPDDDNDGNPDITDPNQKVATAADDTGRTTPNTPVTIDILNNDDFLPGTSTSITRIGGTATGIAMFDSAAGALTYTPAIGETTGSVTVDYLACGTASTPNGCGDATVTIEIQLDTDGDGIPDDIDPDDDNDGNPDITDPNQKVATAVDDTGRTTPNTPVTIDILNNDDFLPGTSTSITRIGGTAQGTTQFDPIAGTLTYTPAVSETIGSVTVGYEACGTASTPNGCDTATVTITISADTDGDGIPDDIDPDDDNDGNPDTTDPNRLIPFTAPDSATTKPATPVTVDVLGNDDFIPSGDIIMRRTGGNATGTVEFDPPNGTVTYTPADGETGTITVEYETCYTLTNVCSPSTLTIVISKAGIITGVVHDDRNRDEVATNDAQLSGVRVELVDSSGAVVATDTTASPFVFTELADGVYTLRLVASTIPDGMYPTTPTSTEATLTGSETVVRNFGLAYALITGTARTHDGQIIPGLDLEVADSSGAVHKAITQLDGTYRIEGRAGRPVAAGPVSLISEIEDTPVLGEAALDRHVPLVFDIEGPPPQPQAPAPPPAPISSPPVVLAFSGMSNLHLALAALVLIELGSIALASTRRRQLA